MNAITHDALMKSAVAGRNTGRAENIARKIMQDAGADPSSLEKVINTGTGLVAYDLQAPAKNLYPITTPVRNMLPRVAGGVGVATNWKAINGLIGSGWDASGWVPEGQRAGQMGYATAAKVATYATLGEEDSVTFEAISAGRTFEDVQASMGLRLLQKTMRKEEMALIGGNNSLALGVPAAPSLAAAGSGGTLPALTYSVIVVALSFEGMKNSSLSGGVATTKTITGADGKSFTLNGGASNKSTAATQAVTLGQTLSCTVTPIQGAVGYAWFVGASGSEKLEAITSLNSITFSAPLAGTGQAAATVAADYSTNATAFDGLLTTALKAGSGAYVKSLATGVAGAGTTLTASGKGTVTEIDDMMQGMFDASQCSPSVLFCGSQVLRDVTSKVLSSGSGSLLNYFGSIKAGEYALAAGGAIEFYYNPFTGSKIPVKIHPDFPPGMIAGWANDLPEQYMSNEVPNAAEVKVREEYYAIDWPLTTRQRQKGVYVEEVLAVYAPFAMGVITNIAKG